MKYLKVDGIDTGVVGFEDGKRVEVDGGDKVSCFVGNIRVLFLNMYVALPQN